MNDDIYGGEYSLSDRDLRFLNNTQNRINASLTSSLNNTTGDFGNAASSVAGIVSGGVGLYTAGRNLYNDVDLTPFTTQNPFSDFGNGAYGSIDQIEAERQSLLRSRAGNRLNADNYKLSTGQKVAGIGSMATNGASLGASIGTLIAPGIGTAIGAGIGGIGGAVAGGLISAEGDKRVDNEVSSYNDSLAAKERNAMRRLNYSYDIVQNNQFRRKAANAAASGGKIEKKQVSLKEFSDSVLNKSRLHELTRSAGLKREYCKGGVRIKLRVK